MNAYMSADRDDQRALTEEEYLFGEADQVDLSDYLYGVATSGAATSGAASDAISAMMAAVCISQSEAEKIAESAPMLLVLLLVLLGVYTDTDTGEVSSKPYAGTGSDADIRVLWRSAQIAAPRISTATMQALREYGKGNLPAILQQIIAGGVH